MVTRSRGGHVLVWEQSGLDDQTAGKGGKFSVLFVLRILRDYSDSKIVN